MDLRRSQFLTLTAMSVADHKGRVRRDLVPFVEVLPPDNTSDTLSDHKRWGTFKPLHAVLVEMVNMLSREGGASLTLANSAIANSRRYISERLSNAEAAHASAAPFIYAGIVQGNDTDNVSSTIHIVGTLAEIGESLQGREMRRQADKTPAGPSFDRLFLADIGKAIANVRRRASENEIDLPDAVDDWSGD